MSILFIKNFFVIFLTSNGPGQCEVNSHPNRQNRRAVRGQPRDDRIGQKALFKHFDWVKIATDDVFSTV